MDDGFGYTSGAMASPDERFRAAIAAIDAANADDPRSETFAARIAPREQLYAERMTAWLARLAPDASEALRLAARAQHIRRWTMPRSDFPAGRDGYLRWRTTLARFHAETAAAIVREAGYDEATAARVASLVRKQGLKRDPEAQLLEDVICLVFLESTFADFARQHDKVKVIGILRKTWAKMSPAGHAAARTLELTPEGRSLLDKALVEEGAN